MKYIDNLRYCILASTNDKKSFEKLPVLMPYRGYDFRVLIGNKLGMELPEVLSPTMYAHVCSPKAHRELIFRFWDSPKEVAKVMIGDLIAIFSKPVIYYTTSVLKDSRSFSDIKALIGEERANKLADDFLQGLEDLDITVMDTLTVLTLVNKEYFKSSVTLIEETLTDKISELLASGLTLDSFSIDLDNDNLSEIFDKYSVLIKYMCKSVTLSENASNFRHSTAGSTVGVTMSRLLDYKYLDTCSTYSPDCFLVSNINSIMKSIKATVAATESVSINALMQFFNSIDINRSYTEYISNVVVTEILKIAIRFDNEKSSDLIKNAVNAF